MEIKTRKEVVTPKTMMLKLNGTEAGMLMSLIGKCSNCAQHDFDTSLLWDELQKFVGRTNYNENFQSRVTVSNAYILIK